MVITTDQSHLVSLSTQPWASHSVSWRVQREHRWLGGPGYDPWPWASVAVPVKSATSSGQPGACLLALFNSWPELVVTLNGNFCHPQSCYTHSHSSSSISLPLLILLSHLVSFPLTKCFLCMGQPTSWMVSSDFIFSFYPRSCLSELFLQWLSIIIKGHGTVIPGPLKSI